MAEEKITYKIEIDDSELSSRLAALRANIESEILNSIQSAKATASTQIDPVIVPSVFQTSLGLVNQDINYAQNLIQRDINNIQSVAQQEFGTIQSGYQIFKNDINSAQNLISNDISKLQSGYNILQQDISVTAGSLNRLSSDVSDFTGYSRYGITRLYSDIKQGLFPEGGFFQNVFRSIGAGYDDRSPSFRDEYINYYSESARTQLKDFIKTGLDVGLDFGLPLSFAGLSPLLGTGLGIALIGANYFSNIAERRDKFAETIRDLGRLSGYTNATKTLGKEISSEIFEFIGENRVLGYSLQEIQENLTDFASTGGFQFVRKAEEFKENIKGVLENLRIVSKTLNMAQDEAAKLMGELERRDIVDVKNQGYFASSMSYYASRVGMSGTDLINFGLQNVDAFRQTGKTQQEAFNDLIDARLETQKIFMATDPYSKQLQWYFGSPEQAAMSLINVGNKFMGSSMGNILSYGLLGGGNLGMGYQDLLMSASSIFAGNAGDALGTLFMRNMSDSELSTVDKNAYMFKSAIDVAQAMGLDVSTPTNLMGVVKMMNPTMSEQEIMLAFQSLVNFSVKEREQKEIMDKLKKGESIESIYSDTIANYYYNKIRASEYSFLDVLKYVGVEALDTVGTYTGIKYLGYGLYGMTNETSKWLSKRFQDIGDWIIGVDRLRYDELVEGLNDEAINALRDYDNSNVKKFVQKFINENTIEKVISEEDVKNVFDSYINDEKITSKNKKILENIKKDTNKFNSRFTNFIDNINVSTLDVNQKVEKISQFYNKISNLDDKEQEALYQLSFNYYKNRDFNFESLIKEDENLNIREINRLLQDFDKTGLTKESLTNYFRDLGEELFLSPNLINKVGYERGVLNKLLDLRKKGIIIDSRVLSKLSKILSEEEIDYLTNERTPINEDISWKLDFYKIKPEERVRYAFGAGYIESYINENLSTTDSEGNIYLTNEGKALSKKMSSLYSDYTQKLREYVDTKLFKGMATAINEAIFEQEDIDDKVKFIRESLEAIEKFSKLGISDFDSAKKFSSFFKQFFGDIDYRTFSSIQLTDEDRSVLNEFIKNLNNTSDAIGAISGYIKDSENKKLFYKYISEEMAKGNTSVEKMLEKVTKVNIDLSYGIGIDPTDIKVMGAIDRKKGQKESSESYFSQLSKILKDVEIEDDQIKYKDTTVTIENIEDLEDILKSYKKADLDDILKYNYTKTYKFFSALGAAGVIDPSEASQHAVASHVQAVRSAIRNVLIDQGYTDAELNEELINLMATSLSKGGDLTILKNKKELEKDFNKFKAQLQVGDTLEFLTASSSTLNFMERFNYLFSEEAFKKDIRLKRRYGNVHNFRKAVFDQNKDKYQLIYLENVSKTSNQIYELLKQKL